MAEGYKISSGEGGLRATATFKTTWANAFTFHDDVLGYGAATVIGPITYNPPWQFPGAPFARLYASSCDIEPIGMDGSALPANLGLAPGEFWTHARIAVTWETPPYAQSAADDPGGIATQLDPANPITYCEQSVESGGTMETRHRGGYEWDPADSADLTAIKQDLAVFVPESRLVLDFPKIPFLPWQRIQTFLGSLNDRVLFQCAIGTLLFESARTRAAATNQGLMGQSFQMTLAYCGHHWNAIPNEAEGRHVKVRRKNNTSKGIYELMDWRSLFA